MYKALRQVLESGQYTIIESFSLPARPAAFQPIPEYLSGSRAGQHLGATFKNGLWSHQSVALEKLGAGENVVISTGTASGKSLIFRAHALHTILTDADARVLVFYPLKALASDQLRGWMSFAKDLGLSNDVVGRIDGSVKDYAERDSILTTARIVIMTPDVCHAWLMSRLSIPVVKSFLKALKVIVMDEAHTLEGVFGSNFAFLVRRLLSARQLLQKETSSSIAPQFVAATATISNPLEQMTALTGSSFHLVGADFDGSPQAERFCAHVAAPPGEEMSASRKIQEALLRNSTNGGFITFVDSRKGVEVLARSSQSDVTDLLGEDGVMPYRAGYDAKDREAIERRLQRGSLRGVVSTSALELGIDLPHLSVGLNIGVPATRKAYRQRLGRVGRSSEGAFLIIASPSSFTSYGTSYKGYHDLSVEPSYLYLDNRFMQFAHARCLADELEATGAAMTLPSYVKWPKGFADIFASAKPGGHRPPEFDAIAQLGGDSPQRSYPLRNVGEVNLKIAQGESSEPFGDVNESQALRECYPGAAYLHMARAWEVVSWHTNAFSPYIKVRPSAPSRHTKPLIKTWINAGTVHGDLMENNLRKSERGFIAECQMQITEKVEGYTETNTGEYKSYQELRQRNPNMRPRMRNFRTSGLLLCIADEWFRKGKVKEWVADKITSIFCREYSLSPQDVGSTATNISVRSVEGGGLRGDCVAVFDQTYGSLRLTERLFLNFSIILDRLEVAVEIEEQDREFYATVVSRLRECYQSFAESNDVDEQELGVNAENGCLSVFTPGSRVCFREKGKLSSEVEIVQPTLMNGQLMYQVKCSPKRAGEAPGKRWVAAEFLEPSADAGAWEYGMWNSETENYETCAADRPAVGYWDVSGDHEG